MLKAVLFDDEPIVLTGMLKKFDWTRYGIELVGTATDGLSALRLTRRLQPDIVLTDIRMPGIDGLQLIEKIARELPNTKFIVFSGYNEFEYVRRAIGLGVIDYLEKPITFAKIESALVRTIERISQDHEFSELKFKWESDREGRLEKATRELLLAGEGALTEWKEAYGSGPHYTSIMVLAFDSDIPRLPEHPMYKEIAIKNGTERLAVLLVMEESREKLDERIETWDIPEPFGSGRRYELLKDARRSYHEALRALRYGRFMKEGGRVRIEEIESRESKLYADLGHHEKSIILSLRTGDKDGLNWALHAYRAWVKEWKVPPERLEQELVKLVFLSLEMARETGAETGELGILRHWELHEMNSLDDMFEWMHGKLNELNVWTTGKRREAKHSSLERVLDYIEERYDRDLSLQELAELVELHPAYLSLLFKERLGVSYSKYLTALRIEKAKGLLRDGERVHEVCRRVGYFNQRHFADVFKRAVGISPGHYREAHSSGRRYAFDDEN
ncbi:response regulator [Cohnella sp.]|uniref:response regulator transcription factor n=1 Tax=Cohnella sp. TaxID=1883426 RepID=UPI003561C5A4